ncbi:phosphatidate cytidylyltransferase [Sphingobacterium sp. SRCM116780]|uniref:phosphatidate cytidylyltransferase n=1 Tax=Sphingobacterium sp. SRCM116780 TaxID=2907623 RepID=UPI001F15A355|nr:phosphatidate cytidylyltransferase [Sphingobacterium sp. SRCM116780]UIR55759.1 phosphatidate cytidylyltransferase [Sphingobacterium sp. SRCM116780]
MKTRAITGFFFIIVMVGSMLLGPTVFLGFFTLLSAWCLFEFYGIVDSEERKPNKLLGILTTITLFTTTACYSLGWLEAKFILLCIPLFLAVYIQALFQKRAFPFNDIGFTILGIAYVGLPFYCFTRLAFIGSDFNHFLPLGFMILLWTNDTGAYLAGRSLGKNKLFERISPKKTWEGFVGGVVLAILVSMSFEKYFGTIPQWQWIVVAIIIGVFGTIGDLVESMLKRSLNVKDSGQILPGHGGFLDRFDGLLFAAPLVYLFLLLMN